MNLEDDWNDLRPTKTKPVPRDQVPLRCKLGIHKWKWSKTDNTVISDCVLCNEHREEYAG